MAQLTWQVLLKITLYARAPQGPLAGERSMKDQKRSRVWILPPRCHWGATSDRLLLPPALRARKSCLSTGHGQTSLTAVTCRFIEQLLQRNAERAWTRWTRKSSKRWLESCAYFDAPPSWLGSKRTKVVPGHRVSYSFRNRLGGGRGILPVASPRGWIGVGLLVLLGTSSRPSRPR
jgi:hypothetical protein